MGFSKIFHVLVPKDKIFFPLIEKDAANLVVGAELLSKMMVTEDVAQRQVIAGQIKDIEKSGDEFTHQIFDALNKTFITPFDREDIQVLASKIDDVLDLINGSAVRFRLFKMQTVDLSFVRMAELILDSAKEIYTAVVELKNLKQPAKVNAACIKINEIENKADDIYHETLSKFFEEEKDAINLIKKTEILETLESATDFAEDVADVIKTILVKSA